VSDVSKASESDIARSIEGHEARNRALLARLRELGAPLGEPRVIDCHFWASNREAAVILVEKLLDKGFTELATTPADPDEPWSVEGKLHEAPEFVASRMVTEELVRLAVTCGAEYDGWGTSVEERS